MQNELTTNIARRIIEPLGANGIPPEYGFQHFSAGLDPYISVIKDEYLVDYIKSGGSIFKMVVGIYGGGKTHFLYTIRDLAWDQNYVISYIRLSHDECPFHKLELIYKAIARGLAPPLTPEELLSGYEKGMDSFLKACYSLMYQKYNVKGVSKETLYQDLKTVIDNFEGGESISFTRAIRSAFLALLDHREDDFANICQWLNGEGYIRSVHGKYGILQHIDKTTAFTMIRSLAKTIRSIGYNGLVVLLDEAEQSCSLSTKQRDQLLSNLREVIDECGQSAFQGVMIFYAVPNENFLEGRSQIYEALKQRIGTVFDILNPAGVKIELEKIVTEPVSFLKEIGNKLLNIYQIAYNHKFEISQTETLINTIAEAAWKKHFGDIGYKRIFVKMMVQGLSYLRMKGTCPSIEEIEKMA